MHAVLSDALATELDRRERLLFQLELLYSRESIRPARIRYWGGVGVNGPSHWSCSTPQSPRPITT